MSTELKQKKDDMKEKDKWHFMRYNIINMRHCEYTMRQYLKDGAKPFPWISSVIIKDRVHYVWHDA